MRLRRVVLPEPLGPLITVIRFASITRLVSCRATNSFGFPGLNTFLALSRAII
jgi:hypothetical protein